ncbi:hypothetical protein JI747_002115 [Chryseobacterium sp. RG1]|uniref:Erythromycin esterase homolog n=1 Tax=Chryseobacterium tagetis TaxID=2801334 RepID=A0ABS7ZW47_9FLAO|nr:hypothetical protein [Chryseobacterium tagetis]MCA6065954.1 hypothetical protein [Chryseobacterium tagetis]
MKKIKLLILTLFIANFGYAQTTLMDSLIQKNYSTFKKNNSNAFEGKGWITLQNEINKNNSVLLGEVHFTNEVPYFTNAIINTIKFDNYILEVDPYTINTISTKIKSSSPAELDKFRNESGSALSFLQGEAEFDLFKNIIQHNIKAYGAEQISLFSDRLLFSELSKQSKNAKAKEIYKQMIANSAAYDTKNNTTFYLFSDDCLAKMNALNALNLSANEKEQIQALKLSRDLYLNRIHRLRIQYLKHLVLEKLPEWKDKKNLFKFGANHMPKGESLMEVFDIGNLVSNIEEANYRTSLHIMLIGKEQGKTLADLDEYKSFLTVVKDDNWYAYDLRPLKQAISKNKLKVDNLEMERIIKGYDYLIFIPNITKTPKRGKQDH